MRFPYATLEGMTLKQLLRSMPTVRDDIIAARFKMPTLMATSSPNELRFGTSAWQSDTQIASQLSVRSCHETATRTRFRQRRRGVLRNRNLR